MDNNAASRLKTRAKKRKKKERFLRTRMWFYTISSALFNDRGTIPNNIGNNIMISNNMYITKNSLNAMIYVVEFSDKTPLAWTSDMLAKVKDKVPDVTIDFVLKNKRYWVDTSDSGLKSRVDAWQATVDNPYTSQRNSLRAQRLLHSVDVVYERVKLYHTRTYIIVRAKTGTDLGRALNACYGYLDSIGALYRAVKSDMEKHLSFTSMLSDKQGGRSREMPYTLQTSETLAESLPMVQGINDTNGTLFGLNKRNFTAYYINFLSSSNAKNVYIDGRSGFGKTFLVQAILIDMYADVFGMIIMDVKGTEFTAFTQATNGVELSLAFNSSIYVNTFVWDKNDVIDDNYIAYTDKMRDLSKQMLMILCDFSNQDEKTTADSLLDAFLTTLYTSIGALNVNPNTWDKTRNLDPFQVFDFLERYISYDIRMRYGRVAERVLDRLRIYLSRSGSCSHMFGQPVNYREILDTKVLTFNFGLLAGANNTDNVAFKLKFFFMNILSDEYSAYRKRKGLWTVEVLEESQIVDDSVLELYSKAITLGRAQNKINILLGNSIAALAQNKVSAAMLDNFSIYVLGKMNSSSRNYCVKEFGLSDSDADDLERISKDPEFQYTFLLVNQMQKNATTALLQAFVPDRVREGKLFKVVDTVED